MWEQRHGFPVPERLPSGHRRFREADVPVVVDVARRRDEGVRLDVAIEQALARARAEVAAERQGPASSVYAELRRLHPALQSYRLRKGTLKALSWAIEDEFCAKASRPHLVGAFQRQEFYRPARARWRELARVARSALVFVDETTSTGAAGPVEVALPPDAPMFREWVVVCDSPELPAALSAWELPGQEGVPDQDRVFESVWTVGPAAVRDAARVCAVLAQEHGGPEAGAEAARVLFELAGPAGPGTADLGTVTTLFNRVVAYVDAAPHGLPPAPGAG
jgi:DICT domain-containing protein